MRSVSEGFRAFKQGLDRRLVWAYWLAIKEHAWEALWGASVVGIPFGIYTLYYAPSLQLLGWVLAWCVLVAGYYAWRAYHVRLTPDLAVQEVIKQETIGTTTSTAIWVQLALKCLSDVPVYQCQGRLLRVHEWDANRWVLSKLNEPCLLGWSKHADFNPIDQHPRAEVRLNVFVIDTIQRQVVLCVDKFPKRAEYLFPRASRKAYRFDIMITYADVIGNSLPALELCLEVHTGSDVSELSTELVKKEEGGI